MKEDRDTQKMDTLPKEEGGATPSVRKFKYETDPGKSDDPDRDLVRNVSRGRDNRDDRAGTIGKLLDEVGSDPGAAPVDAPVRPVRIVHRYSMSTWTSIAAIGVAVAILVIAIVIANSKTKSSAVAIPSASATTATTIASAATSAPKQIVSNQPAIPL